MKTTYRPLALKGFLILWGSQAVSSLGSSLTSFALILWVYQQQHTATSIALLSFFTYLPSILFCFIAGTLADQWNKKKIMLVSDLFAALSTLAIAILFFTGALQVWHLYVANFVNSFMNAFQNPASYVAVSLLVPKEQYARASGLQAFSGSLIRILTPPLASAILSFGSLTTVFLIDLGTFLFAFFVLLFFVKLPPLPKSVEQKKEPVWKSCATGFSFLRANNALLKLILYMSLINFLAYISGYGILPAMILTRSGDNQTTLGFVTSAMGIGMLLGSVLVTIMKPAKRQTQLVFWTMIISFFLGDVLWSLGRSAPMWIFSAFCGNMLVPFTGACMFSIMRTNVPTELQGRVFSARDTLQYCTIPLGLFLGGFLADHVFEPFMAQVSPLQQLLVLLTGGGKGSGMAVIFLITGLTGVIASALAIHNPIYRRLNDH